MKNEIVKAKFIGVLQKPNRNYRTNKYPDVNKLTIGNTYVGYINMYREFYVYNDDTGNPNLLLNGEFEILFKSKYNKRYILIGA